jgi:hypothetical protein
VCEEAPESRNKEFSGSEIERLREREKEIAGQWWRERKRG